MPQLVSVRFRFNPKPFWFDPQDKEYAVGSEVLVETERGREVGIIHDASIEATDHQVSKLKTPLKPIVRELTELDYTHLEALEEKGRNAMPYFREKVEEYELDIKPVEVQYVYSGERAIFYFSSEERVDFRDLVRDLAQYFHVRIDMRQIGARDEAKELGGLAHCGEEFCCTRFGGEFQPVSIRMAKEQDLPLNPSKISGACGRLMCCLRYEYEAYKDFKKRAPKKGTIVDTPLGDAVISGYNTPSETMELKLDDGKKLNVPLGELDCKKGKDGATRCSVSHDTIERCATRSMLIALGSLEQQLEDEVASDSKEHDSDIKVETDGGTARKRRRRSSRKPDETTAHTPHKPSTSAQKEEKPSGGRSKEKPSGGRGGDKAPTGRGGEKALTGRGGEKPPAGGASEKTSGGSRRRRRRNSSNTVAVTTSPKTAKKNQGDAAPAKKQEQSDTAVNNKEKPRPGQRSSGLRKRRSHPGSKEN